MNWSIGVSVALILLGVLALAAPLAAGVAVNVVVAWLLLIAGAGHLLFGWHTRHAGGLAWEMLVGAVYLAMGLYLLFHPLVGLIALTLVLAVYLMIKGLIELAGWIRVRPIAGSVWLLVDGVVSVILSALIWWHLAGTAAWAIGTLVGFAILFSGISRLMLALSARRSMVALR